ncbi:hypothetical protein F5Y14DRAFT_400954 [Nemania sp. NC0429]|nr:hypothetical protein F5Y14DRAFT_400954 [Nemania sp. NC0429]
MSYRIDDQITDTEIAPLRPVRRQSTLPAGVIHSPPSAMRRHSRSRPKRHIPELLMRTSDRQTGARGQRNVVVLNDAIPRAQNAPVIVRNYVSADSDDSEEDRSRVRSRRRGWRYYGEEEEEGEGDDSHGRVHRRRRPDRAPSPYRVASPYPVYSSTSEVEDSDGLYNFTPSYVSVSSGSLEGRPSSADSSVPFLPTIGASPPRTAKTMHIYKAQYTGDACREGSHSSRLTLLHDPRHPQQALFRWIHVQQPVMNFDAFWDTIGGISNLTSSEKSGIKKLLQNVRNRGIRRFVTPHGDHKVMQMKGSPSRKLLSDGTDMSTSRNRAVYWVSLPYFELKKYSSEKYSPELFPAQTLMQADYSQHLMARDMHQAVRQIKEGPEGHCFHISQLWAVVVDNSLLVTCSTMSDDMLSDDRLEVKSVPPKEKSGTCDEPRILVEYRGNTLWAIPLGECLTWFAFITHFWEFWPGNVQFYQHRKLLSPNDWSDIVESVRYGTNSVLLEAVMKPLPNPPARGVLAPVHESTASAKQPDSGGASTGSGIAGATGGPRTATPNSSVADELSQDSKSFSAFAWIQPSPASSRAMTVRVELGLIDQFICKRTRKRDQRAYNECPESTPGEIRAEMERLAVKAKLSELHKGSRLRTDLRDRIDTFNAVNAIFTYFLPLSFTGPSVGKFWGALKLLLDMPFPKEDGEAEALDWTKRQRTANLSLYSARKELRVISRQILLFQQIISHAPDPEKTGIEIPTQLLQAYIYFILAIAQGSVNNSLYWSHMRTFSRLLQAGMQTILKSFSSSSISTYASILPTDVLSLISLKLLGDLTGPYPNINNIYSEWIKTLENEIETKPAVSHQEKIQWLAAEINVITETIEQQNNIFGEIMRRSTSGSRTAVPGQSYTPGDPYTPVEPLMTQRSPPERLRTRSPVRYRDTRNYNVTPARYRENPQSHAYAHRNEDEGSVYSADRDGYDDPKDEFQLSALDPGGYRLLLARDCQTMIHQRRAEFTQFRRKAAALQQANIYKNETRKDYQEQALYAFTVVTVIFLPLSAISSIFGMNTSDVRELEQGQWLYWATAVPVTVGVILIALWWMGELGNAALWLLNLRERQSAAPAPTTAREKSQESVRPPPMRRGYSYNSDRSELDDGIYRADITRPRLVRATRYL